MMDFFFNNSFFTKSLSMQWVYRKQTRWLIITEIKHKAMNKQEVKEFNTAEIAKKFNGRIYKHRYNVHVDQQTKITLAWTDEP